MEKLKSQIQLIICTFNPQKQIEPPHPFVQPPPPVQAAHPPGSNMFNPALYNPTMAAVAAEQQSRFYSQIYRTMAIAAVHQQQQQQQLQQHPCGGPVPKTPSGSAAVLPPPSGPPPRESQQSRPKRRRTSAGNDPSAPPSHLSGEMIRRLREKQKMKNAADVAKAVASVAAVTTSGGRQFDKPQISPPTNSVATAPG